jgi:hypothetical protein
MKTGAAPIALAGHRLETARHVCALFSSDEEEFRVLSPFVLEGFQLDERAVHIINPQQRSEHLQRLAALGIDTASAEQRGQLELRTSHDTYLHGGRFDADRVLSMFEQLVAGNAERGFARSRIICRMDWAASDSALVDDMIEFESRMNDLWRHHDDVVICAYHLGKFGGSALVDILQTHPMVIVDGVLHDNPFFVPPAQFVPEFRERRKQRNRAPRVGRQVWT